jgi:hypothetical protein
VELLTVAPTPALCPPHHWLIEGSNTRSGHQDWTCYRCGVVKAHQDLAGTSWDYIKRQSAKPRPSVLIEDPVPVAG